MGLAVEWAVGGDGDLIAVLRHKKHGHVMDHEPKGELVYYLRIPAVLSGREGLYVHTHSGTCG